MPNSYDEARLNLLKAAGEAAAWLQEAHVREQELERQIRRLEDKVRFQEQVIELAKADVQIF
jgi:hypothetical protein